MEFEVEVSPFLRLKSDSLENRLEFQLARLGWPRGSRPLPSCSYAPVKSPIDYEVYAYYLSSGDYSLTELYHGTSLMSNVHTILSKGHRIVTPSSWSPKTRIQILSYPGRGVVFNVVAVFGHLRIPYVPISTYNCNLNPARLDTCGKMNQILMTVLLSINGLLGIIICFRGHTWFPLQISWSSFHFSLIFGYILIAENYKIDEVTREIYTIIIAIIGLLIWLIIWRIFRIHFVSVITSGLLLGFLIISTLLFTIVGNEDLFRSDFNYWIIVICGTIAVPVFLMPFQPLISIFSSSICGSYAFIFTIDRFIGSSLGFIVINILKRATFKELNSATNEVPFQGKDILIAIVWSVLAFIGMVLQLHQEAITVANRPRIVSIIRVPRARSRHRRSRSRSKSRSRSRRSRSSRKNRSGGTRSHTSLTEVVTSRVSSVNSNVITGPTNDDDAPLIPPSVTR